MGLVIEKQKNVDEGEEKDDDGKRDEKGKRKRKKRDQSKHEAKLKKSRDNDERNAQKERALESVRSEAKISKDEKSISCEGKNLALSANVDGSESAEKELDSGTNNEEEIRDEIGRANSREIITGDKTVKEQRDASHPDKRRDCICDLCCCLGITKDVDDFQDGQDEDDQTNEDEDDEEKERVEGEEDTGDKISKDNEERVSLTLGTEDEISEIKVNKETCPSLTEIEDSNTGDECAVDSAFNIHRPKGKNCRYQSSRPTSLETIIEDVTSSHFSFQDSIMKAFDGREDYRDVRENLDYFQERYEEEDMEEEEGEESRGGESPNDNLDIRPLSSSRIFRGVIENLNYILDYEDNNGRESGNRWLLPDLQESEEDPLAKDQGISYSGDSKFDHECADRPRDIVVNDSHGEEERHCPSPEAPPILPLSITQEELSSMMEKFVQYHHPFAESIAQESADIESPTITSDEVNQCTRDNLPSYPQTKGEKENILTSFSSPSDLGCDSPQVEKEKSLERGIYFPEDVTEGSVIEECGVEGNVVPETTSCIDGNDSEGCNIDGGDVATGRSFDEQDVESGACHLNVEKVKETDDKRVDDANTQSEIVAQETLHAERVVQGSLNIACDADGSANMNEFKQGVVIDNNNLPCTSSGVHGEYLDSTEVFAVNEQEREKVLYHKTRTEMSEPLVDIQRSVSSAVEKAGDEPQRKVSFTVFIQYESINSELVQTEFIDDSESITDSVVASKELVDAEPIVDEEEENPEDAEALDYSVEKEYQLKILKGMFGC